MYEINLKTNYLLANYILLLNLYFIVGHEQMLIFNIWTFFNFQFRMSECLLYPHSGYFTHWSIYLVTISWMKPQIRRYLPLLTYSNKVTFCMKFTHKSGINTINECLGAKILLTNVTRTNEHWNVPTFVCALLYISLYEFDKQLL